GSEIPLGIAGTFYLFFATPFAFFQIFKGVSLTLIEKYFSFLTFYFFIYTPIFFFLNQLAGVRISVGNILITNLIIFAIALIATKLRHGNKITLRWNLISSKRNRLLLAALTTFAIIHLINYHFYRFIPEWDGYADLINIEKGLENHGVAQEYRGFFYTSIGVLSTFSGIQPYTIFTVVFIGLQTSLLLVLSRIIQILSIQKKLIETFVYLLALSVPVINMEVDMTRPQNVVIIFLPILIYFIFCFLKERRPTFFILAAIIAIGGLNYHEFFIFPLLTYALWIASSFFRKALSKKESRESRIIATLILTCIVLVGILATQKIGTAQGVIAIIGSILRDISDTSSWRLWFIGSYSSSGVDFQMGWPGLIGAMKYYAYYLSPALALSVAMLIAALTEKKSLLKNDILIRTILPLLIVFFVFAEILPRLNHVYLPERFWLLMDILLILASIPLLRHAIEKFRNRSRTTILAFISLLCAIGIAGSFYVAIGKKALTSEIEYRAAMWIRKNTSGSSSFITQAANGPMIDFFAKRTTIPVDPEYFLSEQILEQNPETEIDHLNRYVDKRTLEINSIVNRYTANRISFFEFADKIEEQKALLKKTENEIRALEKLIDQPRYVIYSFDKFDTIYRERKWWMRGNAYGANLEKFNRTYPLVYQNGGVYIWKVR
ncbi:MAG: hypothetical protein WAU28_03610, partial [Candidatus Moraniibacteriota bacterium]